MKNITAVMCLALLLSAVFMSNGCKNVRTPTGPKPYYTSTMTATGSCTTTITQTVFSATTTFTQTLTISVTVTPTHTPSPTHTATVTITIALGYMRQVPGGTFYQTDGSSGFFHTLSPFNIGRYEVTYNLWYEIYQWAVDHEYYFANPGREGKNGIIGASPSVSVNEPVTTICWYDMIVWCNAYSEKSGLSPCFEYLGVIIKDSRSTNLTTLQNVTCQWGNNGYRLPTEGEWMYAASYIDGTNWTPYNYASGASFDTSNAAENDLVSWNIANSGSMIHDVGGKTPNALSIYDMTGNVWEYCWDNTGTYPGDFTNYRPPASTGSRVLRGASALTPGSDYLQIGTRYGYTPNGPSNTYGFRLARSY